MSQVGFLEEVRLVLRRNSEGGGIKEPEEDNGGLDG